MLVSVSLECVTTVGDERDTNPLASWVDIFFLVQIYADRNIKGKYKNT